MAAFEAKHKSPSSADVSVEHHALLHFQPRQLFPEAEAGAPKTHTPVLSSIKRRSKVAQRVRTASDEWSPKKLSANSNGGGGDQGTPDNALVRKRVERKRNSNPSSDVIQALRTVPEDSPKSARKKGLRRAITHPHNEQLQELKAERQHSQSSPNMFSRRALPQHYSPEKQVIVSAADASAKKNDDKIISELEKASAHARLYPPNGATVHKFALWQKAKPKQAVEMPAITGDKQQEDASNGYFARHLRQAIGQAQSTPPVSSPVKPQPEPTTTTAAKAPARRRSSRLRTLIDQLEEMGTGEENLENLQNHLPAAVAKRDDSGVHSASPVNPHVAPATIFPNLEDSIQEDEELKILGPLPVDSQEELGDHETIFDTEAFHAAPELDDNKCNADDGSSAWRAQSPPLSIASGDGYDSEGWSGDGVVLPPAPTLAHAQISSPPSPPPPSPPAISGDGEHVSTPVTHGKGQQLRVTYPIKSTDTAATKHRRRPSYNELEPKDTGENFGTDCKSRISWRQGEVVGSGTFAKVYRGLNIKTGELLAIKQVCLAEGTQEEVATLRKEITLMHSLRHPHIVRYLGTDMSDRYLYILLEYVPGGSIASLLSTFGPFSEDLTRKFTYQILLGVKYLHERGIMHRDIKGANVLVTDQGVAKLADFGCSKQLQGMCTASLEESLKSIRGSVPWMAPEGEEICVLDVWVGALPMSMRWGVHAPTVIKQTGHGRSADIWSLGATMIEMATASHPWPNFGNNLAAMFHVATSPQPPPIPEQLSDAAKSFMKLCLQVHPDQRSTAAELCHHEFLQPEEASSNASSLFANELHFPSARSPIKSS